MADDDLADLPGGRLPAVVGEDADRLVAERRADEAVGEVGAARPQAARSVGTDLGRAPDGRDVDVEAIAEGDVVDVAEDEPQVRPRRSALGGYQEDLELGREEEGH